MLIVFTLSLLAEMAYATYTVFVSRGYRWRSVVASALMALLQMVLTYKVVFSIETLPALIVGQAVGTLIVVSLAGRPNTAGSATPLASLLAKVHAFVAVRLKRRR